MLPHDVPTVSVDDLPADAVLLDVREDEEWVAGHISSAVHVPMNRVPDTVSYAPERLHGGPLVVVCRSGNRSAYVTAWLRAQGLDAVNLDGGMLAWATAGRPIVDEDGQ